MNQRGGNKSEESINQREGRTGRQYQDAGMKRDDGNIRGGEKKGPERHWGGVGGVEQGWGRRTDQRWRD